MRLSRRSRGVTTAAVVADRFLLGLVHTSIGNAYDPTNANACANSAGERRRGSKYVSVSNVVRNAELDTGINDPMVRRRHCVKLHNPLRSVIRRRDEGSALARREKRRWRTQSGKSKLQE
jgi:hypothetical protein